MEGYLKRVPVMYESTPKKNMYKKVQSINHSTVSKTQKKDWKKLISNDKRSNHFNKSPGMPGVIIKKINYLKSESPPNRHIHGGCNCHVVLDKNKPTTLNTKLNEKR